MCHYHRLIVQNDRKENRGQPVFRWRREGKIKRGWRANGSLATRSPDYVTRGEGHFFSLRVDLRTRAELRPAITAQRCRMKGGTKEWRKEISKEKRKKMARISKERREEISRCPLAAISGKLNSVREIERGNSTSFVASSSIRILFPFLSWSWLSPPSFWLSYSRDGSS